MSEDEAPRIRREEIENRAVGMWEAFTVEDADAHELEANPQRRLDLLHGIRFGAMAAIEIIGEVSP